MTTNDLDDEYSPKAAARERERAAQHARPERQENPAEPIASDAELRAAVRALAAAWGLRRRAP